MTAPDAVQTELGSLLYVLPSPAGGRVCVTGTGISVRMISWLFNQGLSPEEIAADYEPHLPIEGVYAAIAYYLAHRARLDAEMEAEELEADRLFAHYAAHGSFPDTESA